MATYYQRGQKGSCRGYYDYITKDKSGSRSAYGLTHGIGILSHEVPRIFDHLALSTPAKNGKQDPTAWQQIRISFDPNQLNPDNFEDVYQAINISSDFIEEAFPEHQAFIVPHIDGDKGDWQSPNGHGPIHAHIILSNINPDTKHRLRGNQIMATHNMTILNKVCKKHGYEPLPDDQWKNPQTQKQTTPAKEIEARGEYSFIGEYTNQIKLLLKDQTYTDKDSFKQVAKDKYDIDIQYRGRGLSYAYTTVSGDKVAMAAKKLNKHIDGVRLRDLEQSFDTNQKLIQEQRARDLLEEEKEQETKKNQWRPTGRAPYIIDTKPNEDNTLDTNQVKHQKQATTTHDYLGDTTIADIEADILNKAIREHSRQKKQPKSTKSLDYP